MDAQAVCAADDKELQELGINTRGDILALRVFCKRKSEPNIEQARVEREEKTKQLLAFLKSGESSEEGPSRKLVGSYEEKARVEMAASDHGQWSLCQCTC